MFDAARQTIGSWDAWVWFGLLAQALFFGRFLVQWIATERRRQVTIPAAFWWLSLIGGVLILIYAIVRRDPVFILGFSISLLIYIRNLWFQYAPSLRGARVQQTDAVEKEILHS